MVVIRSSAVFGYRIAQPQGIGGAFDGIAGSVDDRLAPPSRSWRHQRSDTGLVLLGLKRQFWACYSRSRPSQPDQPDPALIGSAQSPPAVTSNAEIITATAISSRPGRLYPIGSRGLIRKQRFRVRHPSAKCSFCHRPRRCSQSCTQRCARRFNPLAGEAWRRFSLVHLLSGWLLSGWPSVARMRGHIRTCRSVMRRVRSLGRERPRYRSTSTNSISGTTAATKKPVHFHL